MEPWKEEYNHEFPIELKINSNYMKKISEKEAIGKEHASPPIPCHSTPHRRSSFYMGHHQASGDMSHPPLPSQRESREQAGYPSGRALHTGRS